MRWISLLAIAGSLIGCVAEEFHSLEPCKMDAPLIVVVNEPAPMMTMAREDVPRARSRSLGYIGDEKLSTTPSSGRSYLDLLPRTPAHRGYSPAITFGSYPRGRR